MIQTGLERIAKYWPERLKGSRVGLLIHPASVNGRLQHAIDLFVKSRKFELRSLFGPQHGIRGETQDNMVEWEGFEDPKTGLPVFSLYGRTRKPNAAMLEDIDVMAIDLQDIGARYYTFIWTMELCMEACEESKKSLVILDRPNPIGGHIIEGPVLDAAYASFVGQRPMPVRHGMTIGETANYLRDAFYPHLDLCVIRMKGWRRTMWFDETGLPWVMPSPNMPAPDTAAVYPGMCLLEGTNISEGRGTTRPFEIFGAPFIDPYILVNRLEELKLPGVIFRPMFFQPAFQKYAGKLCGGAQIHITNRERFKPFKTGVAIIKVIYDLYSEPSSPENLCGKKGHKKTSRSQIPSLLGESPPHSAGSPGENEATIKGGDTNSVTSSNNKIIPSPFVGEGKKFAWRKPPYEYETQKMPIDILAGTDRLRKDIEKGEMLNRMEEWWREECLEFNRKVRKRFLFYE
ncbi:MAG: DUF1343 domain-containing protein [Nitrospirota bacterium]